MRDLVSDGPGRPLGVEMRTVSVGMRLGFASFCVVLPLEDGATCWTPLGPLGLLRPLDMTISGRV